MQTEVNSQAERRLHGEVEQRLSKSLSFGIAAVIQVRTG